MYITTIVKTQQTDNVFAGFNKFSIPLLEGEIIKELDSYYISQKQIEEVLDMKRGDRIMIKEKWNNFNVFITIFKI